MLTVPDIDLVAGVYFILCNANNRVYVGQSTHVRSRWDAHLSQLRCGTHTNKALQQDWRHHSEDAFEFGVLVEVADGQNQSNKLCEIEQIFMRVYQSKIPEFGYNRPDQPRKRPAKINSLDLEANAAAIKYRPH